MISNLPYGAMRKGFSEERTHKWSLKDEYILSQQRAVRLGLRETLQT